MYYKSIVRVYFCTQLPHSPLKQMGMSIYAYTVVDSEQFLYIVISIEYRYSLASSIVPFLRLYM